MMDGVCFVEFGMRIRNMDIHHVQDGFTAFLELKSAPVPFCSSFPVLLTDE
jgi:hypothetical protein